MDIRPDRRSCPVIRVLLLLLLVIMAAGCGRNPSSGSDTEGVQAAGEAQSAERTQGAGEAQTAEGTQDAGEAQTAEGTQDAGEAQTAEGTQDAGDVPADGTYSCEVSMEGGSSRAFIESPAQVRVEKGRAFARITWSSPHYDYMVIDGIRYEPLNNEGNSVFEIPLPYFDREFDVTADTTAMSTPHEIEYRLKFSSPGLDSSGGQTDRDAKNKDGGPDLTEAADKGEAPAGNRGHDISSELVYISDTALEHARNFTISNFEGGYVLITLMDDSGFLLVPEGKEAPDDLSEDVNVLQAPLGNIYVAGSASMDPFRAIGALDAVSFCGNEASDWKVEGVGKAMEEGRIRYAGKYKDPDYEMLISGGCSLAIENTMIFHSPQTEEKLKELGIPVLIDYASYEGEPLGRVEWVKLYGALTGRQKEAQEAFVRQEELAQKRPDTHKTVAFFHIDNSGTAVVRRSDDYIPEMIRTAGGEYIFSDLTGEDRLSTQTIQMEEFYSSARDADYLIYNGLTAGEVHSLDEMLEKSALLADFKAVKEGRVYTVDSDFYQNTMSLGTMISDLGNMLSDKKEGYVFLRKLQ